MNATSSRKRGGSRRDRHSDVEPGPPRADQREVEPVLRVRGGGARDHLRDALVVPEQLDHRAPDAVVEARAQRPQGGEVREGHPPLRVRGEDGRDQGVEDRLGEAAPLLDAGQGGLHLGRAQRDRLVHRPRGLALGGLEEGGHVALHAHVVRQAARGVHHRRRREVVPVGLAVLAVAPEEHARGAALGHGLAQVGHRGHVGRGARQQSQVPAEDLAGGVAGLAQEGGVREARPRTRTSARRGGPPRRAPPRRRAGRGAAAALPGGARGGPARGSAGARG